MKQKLLLLFFGLNKSKEQMKIILFSKQTIFLSIFSILLLTSIISNAQITQLGADIDGEDSLDRSGYSVSMNAAGDRMAIGAIGNHGNGLYSGHVRIYEWDTTSTAWTQKGGDIDGETTRDASGFSVSMNSAGDRVAIGAWRNNGNGNESGHVRIYEWNSTAWVQLGTDIDGEAANDQSGHSVSMNGLGD